MSLHPFFAEKFSSQAEEDPVKLPPEKLRHYIDKALIQMFGDDAWESEADVEIQDELFPTDFGNTRVRFYLPKTDNKEKLPLYLHLHGGGWWLGNVESLDPFCMELASAASCVIASVEYSLSPEATFPEAPEEVYSVLESLAAGKSQHKFDVSRIGIGGNSAGANLATVVSMMARDRMAPPLKCQWLDSPPTDARCSLPSYQSNARGFMLTAESMVDSWSWYLKDNDGRQPYASPLLGNLKGLPPALVFTAEYDPLSDDGRLYSHELKKEGNIVHHHHFSGMVHGFMGFRHLSQSEFAYRLLLKFLSDYL